MTFKVDYCRKFNLRLPDNPSLITGTPILCNIHRYRFEEAGALHLVNGFSSIYWRSNHPVDLFLKQVEVNLLRKYSEYTETSYRTGGSGGGLFYRSRFLKQVTIPLSMGQGRYRPTVIGTNSLFGLACNSELARFALDAGLGELNSLGFGFMNVQHQRSVVD